MDFLFTPTLLLAVEEAGGGSHEGLSWLGLMVYFAIVIGIIFAVLASAKKGLKERVFRNRATSVTEQIYLFVENMCIGIIGPHGKRYVPFITTFWIVIFVANVVSLFFPAAPTSDLGFNLGMALISIGYVQWEGIKSNGLFGHVKHFSGPKLGLALIPITIMILFIEVVSELMKNVSLSLRLFGNIHGGHEAAEAMNRLGENIHIGNLPFPIPLGAFLLPIKVLTCVVQAMLFTLLTCVYISLVTHHEAEHEAHHADPVPVH